VRSQAASRSDGDVSDKGSNLSSLTLAIADLKAIDARLSALVAADPPIKSDGIDLTAAIRESQALVRAGIARLTGAEIRSEAPNDAAGQRTGSAKRRVKIKAESETIVSASPARVETVARSGTAAPKSSSKSATRGADRARGTSTATASAPPATTANAPRISLLARLGAATAEPGSRHPATADRNGTAAPEPAPPSDSPAGHDTDDRLARLEAEIDSLTSATTGGDRSKSVATDAPAAPTTNAVASPARFRGGAAVSAPAPAYRSGADDDAADEEDDAEIVIVTDAVNAAGIAGHGSSSARQGPRLSRDPPPDGDSDAEVEIVQPGTRPGVPLGADGRDVRLSVTPDGDRAKAAASKPAAPAKWRLFRGSS
jgi:hypothetical protein